MQKPKRRPTGRRRKAKAKSTTTMPDDPVGPMPDFDPPPEQSIPAEPIQQPESPPIAASPPSGASSYDAFAGQPTDEQQVFENSSTGSDPGFGNETQTDTNPGEGSSPSYSDQLPDEPGEGSETGEEKPKRKYTKRSDDPDAAPHTKAEYRKFAAQGTIILDVLTAILTKQQLSRYVQQGVLPVNVMDSMVGSLDLTDRERREVSEPAGDILEEEKVRLSPWYSLVMAAAAIYAPRVMHVKQFMGSLDQAQKDGVTIPSNAKYDYTAHGEVREADDTPNPGFT